MPKALRIVVAVSLTTLLLATLAGLALGWGTPSAAADSVYNTLRVYGRAHEGPGDLEAFDPEITSRDAYPEDPPYTLPEHIFNPQLEQAPIKDSLTWNPAFMSEFETFDENHALGLYNQIFAGARNATEKVWLRMWYEPWHWDKDLNANSVLDIDSETEEPFPPGERDEWYPAIMQEFTYMLTEPKLLANKPEPLAGQVGRTRFVFPVGMRKEDLFKPDGSVDATSPNARYGYGLTSFDGDFDGLPDIVHVESELTLFDKTRIAADFNGDGAISPLDANDVQLDGNELVVFHLDPKSLGVNKAIQFLDHMITVKAVFDDSALLEVWYTGDTTPVSLGSKTIFVGDMLLSGTSGPGQHIRALANGGPGTNVCDFPTGPFFVFLDGIDQAEDLARLMVGRALGATWSAMESAPNQTDQAPGDPWFLKRFYVDGHEYNVVAMKTEIPPGFDPASVVFDPEGCSLDPDDWPPADDLTQFKFITVRTPVPKEGVYSDPLTGYLIRQHSVRLQPYAETNALSVMPPFNFEHYVILDVQAISGFDCDEEDVAYFGPLVGPVPPILQQNGPIPYQGVSRYSDPDEMSLYYVEEDKNKQFLGELKQKYGEVDGEGREEFFYVEQFHTLPWEYTEFVLPDLSSSHSGGYRDLYLLTSAFVAPQSEYVLWTQDVSTDTTSTFNLSWDPDEECWTRAEGEDSMPEGWLPRLKFWFDPAEGGKKYKDDEGIRIYGQADEGPGDPSATDLRNAFYPVEVKPYTDPLAPFNPDLPQAPRKDSLTFNPAYLNEYIHGNEPLTSLYRQISIREQNAYEKVFLRMWYEPEYLDKILTADPVSPFTPTAVYTFPAVMQEFTYMYLDTADQPASAQPKSSQFAFPMATKADQLPQPPFGTTPSSDVAKFGWGITSFDANFDGQPDIVHLHSENSLATLTGIEADFDGDGQMDFLDEDDTSLNGNEMVVFALEDMVLRRGESVQFLDHMITLDNVATNRADLRFWYTGGGVHSLPGGYSLHPDSIGTRSLQVREMVIAKRSELKVIPALGDNLGSTDGAWFMYVNAINSSSETVSVIVGRALGHTHTAMDDGAGNHDELPGDPWYLKRFFVDGHEYNVVAVYTEPAVDPPPGDEDYEFKYITIRTPVPKENFVNTEDSQKLEGYFLGRVWGVDTSLISVMPPFNEPHTGIEDVQALPEKDPSSGEFVFDNPDFFDDDCHGEVLKDLPPLEIRIVDEDREPQFFGELKEKYYESGTLEIWQTEQWHMVPDHYTELLLPPGQLYLLSSDWRSEQSLVSFYACVDDGFSEPQGAFDRVKFWYDPRDSKDIYVNTWSGPGPSPTPTPSPTPPLGETGTIIGYVKLQGRTNYSGATVSAGGVSAGTDSSGYFILSGVPVGSQNLTASMPGYLDHVKSVVVNADDVLLVPDVTLMGGDANNDCMVNLFDLVIVAVNYRSSPPSDTRADINGNNVVDLYDLVMVGVNLDQACPGPWVSMATAQSQSLQPAHLRVAPTDTEAVLGEVFTVTLELEGVMDLWGADAELHFDPLVLQVVDADAVTPGVQIVDGTFPDPAFGRVVRKEADNEAGEVVYAITLLGDATPEEGAGTLCSIAFRAVASGSSLLSIESAQLSDKQVEPIEVTTDDGSVTVMSYKIYLPVVIRSAESR